MFTTKTTHAMGASINSQLLSQVESTEGARAIEVSALFEDAVLDVRHLDNPGAGKLSLATKASLGLGGVALGSLLLLFGGSYAQVKGEKDAAGLGAQASEAAPKPAEGRTKDVAAGMFLLLGCSALSYGLWRAASERGERDFSIGSAAAATFKTTGEGLPSERFPLVRSTGSTFEIVLVPQMRGEVRAADKTQSLQEWAAGNALPCTAVSGALAAPIPSGARFVIEHGNNTFLVSSVPAPRRYPVPLRIDWAQQAYTGGVLAGAAAFLGLILAVPPDPRSLSLDAFTNDHIARFLVKPTETPQDEDVSWLKQQKAEGPKQDRGKAAKGEAGKAGSKDAPVRATKMMVQGPKENRDPKVTFTQAKELAKTVGVIGILNSQRGLISSVMSRESALGNEAKDALGNLLGAAEADGYGNNGLGIIGARTGGGGSGENTVGVGDLGRIGGPNGPGGGGYKPGVDRLRKHVVTGPEISLPMGEIKGSLDKELIRRVIRRHLPEVKYCYERELVRNQALEGRVQVHFIIGPTGAVALSALQSSTLSSPGTEQCIVGAVKRWEFPKPQGGIVDVTYPFVLKAAGE